MKFFHLSDLHIGLRLMNRDLREDQEYILKQITDLAVKEKPAAIVIAGDIYDKAVPAAEAVEVLDHFIADVAERLPDTTVLMISGNHDSAPRVNCFRSVLAKQRLHMVGLPPQTAAEHIERVTLQDSYGPVNFYLLPFIKPSMVRSVVMREDEEGPLTYQEAVRRMLERECVDESQRNVLVSHQFYLPAGTTAEEIERMDSEIRTVGNVDAVSAEFLKVFDYVALGHIHKPMKVGSEFIRYCGTPLACSVSEAEQEKGVLLVELGEKGTEPTVTTLPLTPLRRVRVIKGTLEAVLEQACEDYVTAVLTDRADLNVADMRDRLRAAFPYLLEIRRETGRQADYSAELKQESLADPYALCCKFLGDPDGEEKAILKDVVNQILGVTEA